MKILLTGFEPFGKDTVNPSWLAVEKVADKIGRFEVVKAEIPVVFEYSTAKLYSLMEEHKPDAILLTGLAANRKAVSVETRAINNDFALIPDNNGNKPENRVIVESGEQYLYCTYPCEEIVREIKEQGIDCELSDDVGMYVCNHLLYTLLHRIKQENLDIRAGFIHVPMMKNQREDQDYDQGMEMDDMVKAIEIAIKVMDIYAK